MAWYLIPLFFWLSGCSLQKMALRSSTPIFEKSSKGLMEEGNWDFFRASSPGNLKFLELLWQQDKENLKLLAVLIKGYSGYAFAVPETLAFQDALSGQEDSTWKNKAILFYTRALDYGLIYLEKKNITREILLSHDERQLKKKLKNINEKDLIGLLYTAQAWGSLINLQKDNVALVSQIPKVKLIFDRVCKLKPDIDHNVCDLFYAQYEASRPKMLGGNPEYAEKLYLEAMAKHPKNLLIRISYIQYLLLPAYAEEKYSKQADFLRAEFSKLNDLNRDALENKSPYKDVKELNLYNGIAEKRFFIIEKYKDKIF
jgi:hypothetical protein